MQLIEKQQAPLGILTFYPVRQFNEIIVTCHSTDAFNYRLVNILTV